MQYFNWKNTKIAKHWGLRVRASAENFSGRGATEKIPKISKKYRKIALFSLFHEGGGAVEKKPKNSKKRPKIALLILYYICTMYENPGGASASATDTHGSASRSPIASGGWGLHLQTHIWPWIPELRVCFPLWIHKIPYAPACHCKYA